MRQQQRASRCPPFGNETKCGRQDPSRVICHKMRGSFEAVVWTGDEAYWREYSAPNRAQLRTCDTHPCESSFDRVLAGAGKVCIGSSRLRSRRSRHRQTQWSSEVPTSMPSSSRFPSPLTAVATTHGQLDDAAFLAHELGERVEPEVAVGSCVEDGRSAQLPAAPSASEPAAGGPSLLTTSAVTGGNPPAKSSRNGRLTKPGAPRM